MEIAGPMEWLESTGNGGSAAVSGCSLLLGAGDFIDV